MTRVLVTGASGQLGCEVVAHGRAAAAGTRSAGVLEITGVSHADMDVADRERVLQVIRAIEPDVVVHAAAWTDVDGCETDPERAFLVNALGTRNVNEAANAVGAHLCYLSTDYVFNGECVKAAGYHEWDMPDPLNTYGASKLAGERELSSTATVVRTSWLCGTSGSNIVRTVLSLAAGGSTLKFVDDQVGCPTFTEDLTPTLFRLAIERRPGIFHVTNQGATSWFGFVQAILEVAGFDSSRVVPIATKDLDPPRAAPRPANSILDNLALRLTGDDLLPHWREGLGKLVRALQATMDT